MVEILTPVTLQLPLLARLQAWRSNLPLVMDPSWDPQVTALIASQDIVGWKNFLEGLPSTSWIPYITAHYYSCGIRKSPGQWLQKLLQSVHTLAWSQWEHRNDVLHRSDQPRLKMAISALDDVIIDELLLGPQALPPPITITSADPLVTSCFSLLPISRLGTPMF